MPVLGTLKAERRSRSLFHFDSRQAPGPLQKDSETLLFRPSALFTRVSQSAADWDTRFRGFSNDVCRERCRGYSFRETVTLECKDRRYSGTEILMTRCNAWRLSSVPSLCIMHATGKVLQKCFLTWYPVLQNIRLEYLPRIFTVYHTVE